MAWEEKGRIGAIPPGGSAGQVLAKASAADKDVAWSDPSGSGGLPPSPYPGAVLGVDEFGHLIWKNEHQLEGATAWLTSNLSISGGSASKISFGDAEQHGQLMWSLDDPTRLYIRRDGWYIVNAGLSSTDTNRSYRIRIHKNDGLRTDLSGSSSSHYVSQTSLDLSATGAPSYYSEGDFLDMRVFVNNSGTLLAAAKSTYMSVRRVK